MLSKTSRLRYFERSQLVKKGNRKMHKNVYIIICSLSLVNEMRKWCTRIRLSSDNDDNGRPTKGMYVYRTVVSARGKCMETQAVRSALTQSEVRRHWRKRVERSQNVHLARRRRQMTFGKPSERITILSDRRSG